MIAVQVISKRTRFFQLVQPFFNEAGIELISVHENTIEALESFNKYISSIVLLDANLNPGINEYSTPQVILELRKINPSVSIVLFTNTREEFIIEQLKQYCINGYFWLSMDNLAGNLFNRLQNLIQLI